MFPMALYGNKNVETLMRKAGVIKGRPNLRGFHLLFEFFVVSLP